jgi:hypothetical protein
MAGFRPLRRRRIDLWISETPEPVGGSAVGLEEADVETTVPRLYRGRYTGQGKKLNRDRIKLVGTCAGVKMSNERVSSWRQSMNITDALRVYISKIVGEALSKSR